MLSKRDATGVLNPMILRVNSAPNLASLSLWVESEANSEAGSELDFGGITDIHPITTNLPTEHGTDTPDAQERQREHREGANDNSAAATQAEGRRRVQKASNSYSYNSNPYGLSEAAVLSLVQYADDRRRSNTAHGATTTPTTITTTPNLLLPDQNRHTRRQQRHNRTHTHTSNGLLSSQAAQMSLRSPQASSRPCSPLSSSASSLALASSLSLGASSFLSRSASSFNLESLARGAEETVVPKRVVQQMNKLSLESQTTSLFRAAVSNSRRQSFDELRVQIASDLHIEMFEKERCKPISVQFDQIIVPSAPILALAGDIGCPGTPEGLELYKRFILKQAKQFDHVLVLAGNHEFYINSFYAPKLTVDQIKARIQDVCDLRPNVHFLDRRSLEFGNVRIVGCTLWTDIPEPNRRDCESTVKDYHVVYVVDEAKAKEAGVGPSSDGLGERRDDGITILDANSGADDGLCYIEESEDDELPVRPLRSKDTTKWHREDVEFIKQEVTEAAKLRQRCLVITHHAPTFKHTSNPTFVKSPIRFAFSTPLESMFFSSDLSHPYYAIHTWVSGHTHWSCDQVIDGVRVVSNQYGYTGNSESLYRAAFVVAVGSDPPQRHGGIR